MASRASFSWWLKRICSLSITLSVCPVEVQNLNVTRDVFSCPEEMQQFFEILNECHHNQAEGLYVDKSMNAYSNWMNRMYFLQSQSNQEKIMKMQSKLQDICKLYRENKMTASEIDDFYWDYYETLSIPNRSMNCSVYGVNKFVEFILLKEEYEENKKEILNVLDIGCGTGLVGMSLIRSINKHKLNKYIKLNIEGFDHSNVALKYGKNEKYWNYLSVYNKVWKQDLFDDINNNKQIKQYDVVFASDLLYQLPLCGCIGINAVKKAFEFVKNGGCLVIINPIQVSTPCVQQSYQKILEPFYLENNIICLLDGIIDTIDHNKDYQRLDAVYVHIRILYKGYDTTVDDDHFAVIERPCVNLMK